VECGVDCSLKTRQAQLSGPGEKYYDGETTAAKEERKLGGDSGEHGKSALRKAGRFGVPIDMVVRCGESTAFYERG
jgi:hypothetical protein